MVPSARSKWDELLTSECCGGHIPLAESKALYTTCQEQSTVDRSANGDELWRLREYKEYAHDVVSPVGITAYSHTLHEELQQVARTIGVSARQHRTVGSGTTYLQLFCLGNSSALSIYLSLLRTRWAHRS